MSQSIYFYEKTLEKIKLKRGKKNFYRLAIKLGIFENLGKKPRIILNLRKLEKITRNTFNLNKNHLVN